MRKLTSEEFIVKCELIHGCKFDYSQTKYEGYRNRINVICRTHGEFQIFPDNHLKGQGCAVCARKDHKLVELSIERLENIKKIHGDKYLYDDITITNGSINVVCKNHGKFTQTIYNHERGHGCPECKSTSKGEDKIKNILQKNKIEFIRNHTFSDCLRSRRLKFDFYLPKFNMIIEYDGEHHFHENKYFTGEKLKYTIENDKIKNDYCCTNGIKLIRIPYWKFKDIESIIDDTLI